MTWTSLRARWQAERMRPDLGRGGRCMVSFMAPLLMSAWGHLPVIDMVFTAVAAQSLANVDVRGPYSLRVTLLLAKSMIIAAAAALGALTGHPLWLALAATALIALGAGYWRHLSTEYGPSLAVASGLVFYIALAYPGGPRAAQSHFVAALAGGCWGMLLQIALWPFHPQHPLRVAVSDGWLACADLIAALSKPAGAESLSTPFLDSLVDGARGALAAPANPHLSEFGSAGAALRQALDRGSAALDSAAPPGRSEVIDRLRALNRAAALLALRISAYASARQAVPSLPEDWGQYEAPFLAALQNLARTIAVAVVSRNPGHLAAANVRVRRVRALAQVLCERTGGIAAAAPLGEALQEIRRYLPEVDAALTATVDRAGERAAFSLELNELSGAPLRPLALALNLRGKWDRALLRFTARIGALTVIGVALMKTTHFAHGYWLPFTMILVLQPDYGSTRQKAAQRLLGTLGGSLAASALLGLHPPWPILMAAVALCCLAFGYTLKRHYAVSVIFITVFVVALMESLAPQTLRLTEERLGLTLLGGMMALWAAFLFWPVWERDRVRPVLARGLRSNAELIRLAFSAPSHLDDPPVIRACRQAERANAEVFSSLQRMAGDPKDRQDRLETLAAVANGNQRLTSAVNLALLQQPPPLSPGFVAAAGSALGSLAQGLATGRFPDNLSHLRRQVALAAPPGLARAAAEISALALAAQELEFQASVPVPAG